MKLYRPLPASQRGAVLITSLIFLVMLTIVAVVANQSTVLETRMSTNTIVKARAVEASEALRMVSNADNIAAYEWFADPESERWREGPVLSTEFHHEIWRVVD